MSDRVKYHIKLKSSNMTRTRIQSTLNSTFLTSKKTKIPCYPMRNPIFIVFSALLNLKLISMSLRLSCMILLKSIKKYHYLLRERGIPRDSTQSLRNQSRKYHDSVRSFRQSARKCSSRLKKLTLVKWNQGKLHTDALFCIIWVRTRNSILILAPLALHSPAINQDLCGNELKPIWIEFLEMYIDFFDIPSGDECTIEPMNG
jgi:hypothetical protein